LLSIDEIAFVQDRIRSVEQDWFALAPVLGDAFLHEDFIFFYDGETMNASDVGFSSDLFVSALMNVCRRLRPERIELTHAYEAQHADLLALNGFTRVWCSGEEGNNWEVVLPFSGVCLERFKTKARGVRRRNRRFNCSLQQGPLSPSHRNLLFRYARRFGDDLTTFDRRSIEILPDLLAESEYGITLNAFEGNQLVGFAQGHTRYAPRLGIFLFCVAPDRLSQLSDCLYVGFLEEVHSRGIQSCSLGATIWPGLYRYKTKWGAVPLAGPYRYETWVARTG
jgi:hypothetical protein